MTEVFASAMGQYDNVGDTVLRRPFLRALRGAGKLNVFVGNRSEDYISALHLDDTDRLFRDSSSWRKAVTRAITRNGAVYAFNAGEIEVTRPYAAHYVRLAPLLVANKLRGGRSLHIGLGVRRPTRWIPAVRGVLSLCDMVSWRDEISQQTMGLGHVAPDWAFAEGASDAALTARMTQQRNTVVFAPRYNGAQPDEAWCERFAEMADRLGLNIVVAAQIQRDNAVVDVLAKRWGAEAVVWEDGHHARQETRLRRAYAEARVVVSERLHALVIGATEGAVPVALGHAPSDKAYRTIRGAGLPALGVSANVLADADVKVLQDASTRSTEVCARVGDARRKLDEVVGWVHGVARG